MSERIGDRSQLESDKQLATEEAKLLQTLRVGPQDVNRYLFGRVG